jgi:hypothetical protein
LNFLLGIHVFRRIKIFVVILLTTLCAVTIWNYFSAYRPVSEVIDNDPCNSGTSVFTHHLWFVSLNVLVFDLRSVPESPL